MLACREAAAAHEAWHPHIPRPTLFNGPSPLACTALLSCVRLCAVYCVRLHFQLEVKVKDLAPETVGLVAQGSQDPEAQAGYAKLVPLAIGKCNTC